MKAESVVALVQNNVNSVMICKGYITTGYINESEWYFLQLER